MESKIIKKKSKARAIACFACGMIFWIPLLNLIFGVFGIYLGITALLKIKKNPNEYGGKIFAIIGLLLCLLVYVFYFTGLGLCLYGNKAICTAIGIKFPSS